ncbi:acyloxyacyl hydrolase [Usitatibacter palustris]|uniref:acyloxyacyl hydrolase n=1 Tax=Usitatibacter palustris TaxID=2732487 RepID=UPI001489C0EC|nr:acyloxyacyl hydrolase [Usitatibacter palustris]
MLAAAHCLFPWPCGAEDLRLLNVGVRAQVSGATVLGDVAPEEFQAYDASATFKLRWERYNEEGWGVGTRLMASAGALRGAGETALTVSLIPVLAFGTEDGRFTLDLGAGAALLSRHQFGTQDFGRPFQFALTFGVSAPLYDRVGVGYRFMHYSDAGLHGPHTTGADLHMIELTYRF